MVCGDPQPSPLLTHSIKNPLQHLINNNDEECKEKISNDFEIIKKIQRKCLYKAFAINLNEIIDIEDDNQTEISLFNEFLNYNLKVCNENKILDDILKVKIVFEVDYLSFIKIESFLKFQY